MRVADFHCDLLSYLSHFANRSAMDPQSQASLPFLQQGGVALQTFPIYTVTGTHSVDQGTRQFEIFNSLSLGLHARLAIENSSSFCLEDEPIENGLRRLESWNVHSPLVYISLTWNGENRFGGGCETTVGLKEDGKKLLKWMSGKKIAVDLSHASDALARDILEEIQQLDIVPVASHSNFRFVCNHPRNVTDEIAGAIAKKGGLIGLNMVRHFLGTRGPQDLLLHIEHARQIGIEESLCLGTDFFAEVDVAPEKAYMKPYFFEGFSTSACFPQIRQLLSSSLSETSIHRLMYDRLNRFLESP